MEFVPNMILMGTATMEELSSTLAKQTNDQDRYVLAETIIVAQVALRDKLLGEQQTMIDKIRGLEEKIAASRMDTVPFKNPELPSSSSRYLVLRRTTSNTLTSAR
jgi:hypothetical protein